MTERRPPQNPIAQRHDAAAETTETAKPTPASQSHFASAVPIVASAAATRVPEELRRRHGDEEGDQKKRGCGDAAASDPGLDLGECCVHDPALHVVRRTTELEVGRVRCRITVEDERHMNGAIAAGHPLTAKAGVRVLRAGGSAVDACVAAALVSWVCESPLTGPGGGGFMLVHEAESGKTTVFDFFVSVPKAVNPAAELLELAVDFDGDTQQMFRTGAAAVAVPGTALGLEAAHRRFGRMPWAELVAPAAALARDGVELTPMQGYLHSILDPLLRHSTEGDAMYGRGGRPYRPGDRFAVPELGDTLDRLAREGAAVLYRGELAEAIVSHVAGGGGALAPVDLAAYEVIEREPISVEYHGREFPVEPPAVERRHPDRARPPGARNACADAGCDRRRDGGAGGGARRGVRPRALHRRRRSVAEGHDAHLGARRRRERRVAERVARLGLRRRRARHRHPPEQHARRSRSGRSVAPGERLTSMMAPSIVLDGARRGSWSVRGGRPAARRDPAGRRERDRPRDGRRGGGRRPAPPRRRGVVHCERPPTSPTGSRPRVGQSCAGRQQNLYFGGVSAVEVRDGTASSGSRRPAPRRGGAVVA